MTFSGLPRVAVTFVLRVDVTLVVVALVGLRRLDFLRLGTGMRNSLFVSCGIPLFQLTLIGKAASANLVLTYTGVKRS